jgi:hypothetical protein
MQNFHVEKHALFVMALDTMIKIAEVSPFFGDPMYVAYVKNNMEGYAMQKKQLK